MKFIQAFTGISLALSYPAIALANPCSKPIFNVETMATLYGKKGKPMPVKAFIGTGAIYSILDSSLAKHLDWHHRPIQTVYTNKSKVKERKILLSGPFRLQNLFKIGQFSVANRDRFKHPILLAPGNLSNVLVRVNSSLSNCSIKQVLSLVEKIYIPSYHNATHIPVKSPISTETPFSLINEKLADHQGYLNRQTLIGKMPVEGYGEQLRDVIKIPIVLKGQKQQVIFAVIPELKSPVIIGKKALTNWFVEIP